MERREEGKVDIQRMIDSCGRAHRAGVEFLLYQTKAYVDEMRKQGYDRKTLAKILKFLEAYK